MSRPTKNTVDPKRPYAYCIEPERTSVGVVEDVATVFLTNRECPFRCLMCDLWKNTTDHTVSKGDIPGQIQWALRRMPPAQHVKLYNSGNFFDSRAIPESDYAEIVTTVSTFDTVIVESHPSMVSRRCFKFADMLPAQLDVAIGLETVHPDILPKLNKRMTTDDFSIAVRKLVDRGIRARAFILLRPPFMTDNDGVVWAKRSLDFAFDTGVECCAIIPTRAGNGAMDALAQVGDFHPPSLDALEEVIVYGLSERRGRVFADLWDIESAVAGAENAATRIERLQQMNLQQTANPRPASDQRTNHRATRIV